MQKTTLLAILLIVIGISIIVGFSLVIFRETKELPPTTLGELKLVYTPVKTPYYLELEQWLKASGMFEDTVNDLNKYIVLPVDILVIFSECGEANAYYNPTEVKIVICYELIERFVELFGYYLSDEELTEAVVGVTYFVFYHELGHALVDVLDLPITGKEEDAVDQLATLILVESGNSDYALTTAIWFYKEGVEKTNIEELAFWGEHSLEMQRFYNIICWIYGYDQKTYSYLVEMEFLPEERAVRCPFEYKQLSNSWSTLLTPHLKVY